MQGPLEFFLVKVVRLLPACLPALAPCEVPFDTASRFGLVLSSAPPDFLVAIHCSTGDQCYSTLQPPPLHVDYLGHPQILTRRISCVCCSSSQTTLRCRISPPACAPYLAAVALCSAVLTPTVPAHPGDRTCLQVLNSTLSSQGLPSTRLASKSCIHHRLSGST